MHEKTPHTGKMSTLVVFIVRHLLTYMFLYTCTGRDLWRECTDICFSLPVSTVILCNACRHSSEHPPQPLLVLHRTWYHGPGTIPFISTTKQVGGPSRSTGTGTARLDSHIVRAKPTTTVYVRGTEYQVAGSSTRYCNNSTGSRLSLVRLREPLLCLVCLLFFPEPRDSEMPAAAITFFRSSCFFLPSQKMPDGG